MGRIFESIVVVVGLGLSLLNLHIGIGLILYAIYERLYANSKNDA